MNERRNVSTKPISFQQYLHRRGYDSDAGSAAFLRRMFVTAWAQPGFHRFWRIWNPLYGYFLFRLYAKLGGRRNHTVSSIAVFLASGFVLHDLPISLLTGRPFLAVTIAFCFYGCVARFTQRREKGRGVNTLSSGTNTMINLLLVLAGLALGGLIHGTLLDPLLPPLS